MSGKKFRSTRSVDQLFEGFVDKHANFLIIICWIVIFISGMAVLFSVAG